MKKNLIVYSSLLTILSFQSLHSDTIPGDMILSDKASSEPVDVTFFSTCNFADGIGRRVIGQIGVLKDHLNVRFFNTRHYLETEDVKPELLEIFLNSDSTPGTVMLWEDGIYDYNKKWLDTHEQNYKIKLIYLTVESTKAPVSWVKILNEHFDGILAPDQSVITALQNSGVVIPGFVMPEICFIEEFLSEPLQEEPHYPFTFGVTATALSYKNYDLLLEAFAAEFGNSPDVILKAHNHRTEGCQKINDKIRSLMLRNAYVTHGPISRVDYGSHMKAIDCYVLLSKGEGFSITPREAMALGRPCILANHSAHQTICNAGFVRPVEASIIEKHDSENYFGEDIGNIFNCELSEARKALRDVYENYQFYLKKAHAGREWAKQYLGENLRAKYISMIKPKMVILGDRNEATCEYLMTNSQELYDKYTKYVIEPSRNMNSGESSTTFSVAGVMAYISSLFS